MGEKNGAMYKQIQRGTRYDMKDFIHNRCIKTAEYFISNDTTIRETAKALNSSKGTVHTDLIKRLPDLHPKLYIKVRDKLEQNKSTRHMRGGLRTKEMWAEKKKAAELMNVPATKEGDHSKYGNAEHQKTISSS